MLSKILINVKKILAAKNPDNKYLRLKRNRVANIAMLHSGRCGSTVLGDLLNQHGDVYWASEIFNDLSEKYKWIVNGENKAGEFLEKSMYAHNVKYYGFETKFLPELHLGPDYINMDLAKYIRLLQGKGFTHFITLYRKNYLKRAVSAEVGRKTNEWHRCSVAQKPTTVLIDVYNFKTGCDSKPLLELFQSIDESYANLSAITSKLNNIDVIYEDDILKDPISAYYKIAQFIGLDISNIDVAVRLNRTNPFCLSELIVNYDEVASYLRDTKYEWMLSD